MSNSSPQSSEDFISAWLEAKRDEGILDLDLVSLIEKHLQDNGLRESQLLSDLLSYAESGENPDEAD